MVSRRGGFWHDALGGTWRRFPHLDGSAIASASRPHRTPKEGDAHPPNPKTEPHASRRSGKNGTRTHLAIHGRLRDVELPDHAEGNGPAARLGVVHLPLEQDRVDALLLSEDLRGTRPGGSAADDCHLVLHVQRGRGGGLVGDAAIEEGGGGEGRGGTNEEGRNC